MPRRQLNLAPDTFFTEQQLLNLLTLTSYTGGQGGKTLASEATAVPLETDVKCRAVFITCRTGIVALGFSSDVNAEPANAKGMIITPGSTVVPVICDNLNEIYVAGNGRITYAYH